MQTQYTREYYERNKDYFEGKREVITPEKDLEYRVSCLDRSLFTEETWGIILKVNAKEIIERTEKELAKKKELYLKVRKDRSCLGFTSAIQEVAEAHRIVQVFEYNCFKLSKFKAEYSL